MNLAEEVEMTARVLDPRLKFFLRALRPFVSLLL